MSATALVIVLVGAGESGSDWAAGMLQALREALDRSVVIDVRERGDEGERPPTAFVLSVELSPAKTSARLSTEQPQGRPSKDITFARGDRPLDRGRAIGYALGALLPELRADAPKVEPEPLPPPPPPPAPSEPNVPAPPTVIEVPVPIAVAVPVAAPRRVALEVEALGARGIDNGLSGGAALGIELTPGKGVSVRALGFGLFGGSPLANTELRRYGAELGARLALFAVGPLVVSIAAWVAAIRMDLSLGNETLGRWVGAAGGAPELAVELGRVAIFLQPAFVWAFGSTAVYVRGVRQTTLTEGSFQLALGLRWWP